MGDWWRGVAGRGESIDSMAGARRLSQMEGPRGIRTDGVRRWMKDCAHTHGTLDAGDRGEEVWVCMPLRCAGGTKHGETYMGAGTWEGAGVAVNVGRREEGGAGGGARRGGGEEGAGSVIGESRVGGRRRDRRKWGDLDCVWGESGNLAMGVQAEGWMWREEKAGRRRRTCP